MNPRKPFIIFDNISAGLGKRTETWIVRNKLTGIKVGAVKWQPSFRKYGFFPEPNMVFDDNCLDYISKFLTNAMKEHLNAKLSK